MSDTTFVQIFSALTGNEPFPWQGALFERFAVGDIPSVANLPTGLGKTSVVAIWLIAAALHPSKVPRRLVYVVNRRTVVDQTTDEVEKLRRNLKTAGIEEALRRLCTLDCDSPLALSTLRGQFADNREWSADPSRPAVIVGTVDMIGSRLLFSGYGSGFKVRPIHAGFLGQDALIVHDEAHLEPAFQALLSSIEAEQRRSADARKLRVLELSATSRGDAEPFGLTPDDKHHPVIARRLEASKSLHLRPIADEKKQLVETLSQLALSRKESGRAVIVFARSVEAVEKIADDLRKNRLPHETLTGTLRGKERDELVKTAVFRRFRPSDSAPTDATEHVSGTVVLVCTSAGEVGVNISADHVVCDLTTFESMAQRFGRVNRFGDRSDTEIHVVHPEKFDDEDPFDARRAKTLALLTKLNGSASPLSLGELDATARRDAFSPPPKTRPATEILFDIWSMTSVREQLPGRPIIAPYLHGEPEYELPETHVAWRTEVRVIAGGLRDLHPPEDLLADYPLKPHELQRDRSDRVFKHIAKLAERRPDIPTWLIAEDGTVEVLTLGEVAATESKNVKERLGNCTLVLPPEAGGLSRGLLDGGTDPSPDGSEDVADDWFAPGGKRRRIRIWNGDPNEAATTEGMRLIREIDVDPESDEPEDELSADTLRRYWRWYEVPTTADGEGSRTARSAVLLDVHSSDVERTALAFARTIGLPDQLLQAVVLAARFHDLGKRRRSWQRGIGSSDLNRFLAKSGRGMRLRDVGDGYRHEFGSVIDAQEEVAFRALVPEQQDIVLHLIAAHHGRGRPHFPREEIFDPENGSGASEFVAADVPLRFARLQRRFGRWGLAFLESLLRAADYHASAHPSQTLEGNS